MAYVGTPIDTRNQFQSLQGKRFSGDGSTTAFTLDVAPSSTLDIEVFVGNVRQDPNSAYTLSGTTLTFTGAPPSGTNNIYVVHQAKAVGTIDLPEGALVDLNGGSDKLVLDADGDTTISADTDDQIDFKAGGTDVMHVINGNVGILGVPTQAKLHIITNDSGALNDANSDDFMIENTSATGMAIGSSNTGEGHIYFSDSDDADVGAISYFHSDNYMRMRVNASEALRFTGQEISTGGETAPDVDAGGITSNHGSSDGLLMTFKNSDIAHGMTGIAETDTYGAVAKFANAQGGLRLYGLSDASGYAGLDLFAVMGGASNTGEAEHVNGILHLETGIKSGTSRGAAGDDENLVCIKNNGATEVIFKGDGEIFSNQTATVGTYDTYEDAQLIRAYDLNRGKNVKGLIDSKFDKFVQYNQKDLMDAKLIGKDEDGNPTNFVNLTGMSRLHNGAIWQQYEKHNQLLEAVYDLAKEAVGEEKANAILDKHEVKRLQ